jgi:C1A family cysteine protease
LSYFHQNEEKEMIKYSLGWLPDYPDFRDRLADSKEGKKYSEATAEMLKLDKSALDSNPVDLRRYFTPIEDQEDIGSCTAQAGAGLVEYIELNQFGEYLDASRLFLYKVTRNLLGLTGDTGALVRTTLKALRLFGTVPEMYYPYDTVIFDEEPDAFCYSFAGNYKILSYYRLRDLNEIKRVLKLGLPVAFGFTVFRSIFNQEVTRTGVIPFPSINDRVAGGHAVVAVGFNDQKKQIIIRNSWGIDWGDQGYGYLPYKYFEKGLTDDYWILVKTRYESLREAM